MWYELLKKMAKEIEQSAVVRHVKIGPYMPEAIGVTEEGAAILMRGEEDNEDPRTQEMVKAMLYLELWVREDSQELDKGYERLAALEHEVEKVITLYRDKIGQLQQDKCMLDERWQVLDIYVDKKTGGWDSKRPLLGTQYTVIAKLYDTSEEEGIW